MQCSWENVILCGIFHVIPIMFSSSFNVISRKFGLVFGQCGTDKPELYTTNKPF